MCVLLSCPIGAPAALAAAGTRVPHASRVGKQQREAAQPDPQSSASEAAKPEATETAPASATPASVAPPPVQPQPGAIAAWGENFYGQLGAFWRDPWELSPLPVEGVASAVELAPGTSFNLARLADGTVVSWGGGKVGQLGTGRVKSSFEEGAGHMVVMEENPSTHAVAGPLHGVKQVAAANLHAMALMQDGTVRTWGANGYGQSGSGSHGTEKLTNVNLRLPRRVPGVSAVKAIAAGGASDYALTESGTVLAWGSNTEGQLGIGQQGEHCETETAHYPRYELCSARPLPVMWLNPATGKTEELREVQAIAAGTYAAYALLKGGRVLSWGSNHKGELGTGGPTWRVDEVPPGEVKLRGGAPLTGVVELVAGFDDVLARLQNGSVVGWGSSEQGALAGVGSENCGPEPKGKRGTLPTLPCATQPTAIPALEALHPEALAAGHHFGLALEAGTVYAWGDDEYGQLGSGQPHRVIGIAKRTNGTPEPVRVSGIGQVAGVAAGGNHSLALLASGVTPPPPLLAAAPAPLALGLSWRTQTSNGTEPVQAERLLYRASERGGEPEPAEQGKTEEEDGAPFNLALEPAYLTIEGDPVEGGAAQVGRVLWAEPGGWSGARPIVFSYQWQRCLPESESCVNLPGKTFGGYRPTSADIGYTLRAAVTASGPEGPPATVYTPATGPVEAPTEGEKRHGQLTSVRVSGTGYTIHDTVERLQSGKRLLEVVKPLEAIPYEVKLRSSGRTRATVLTPLG